MRHWKFTFSIFNFVSVVLAAALLFFTAVPVFAGSYLDSAHGSSTYGVNRDRTAAVGYATGNCAHCHEQHGSIEGAVLGPHDYLLFYDFVTTRCNLFCYWCHREMNSEGQAVTNYPYSVTFGGATQHYGNIYNQFCAEDSTFENCGSNHDLAAIRNFIRNRWGFPSEPDPCAGCHNPHIAQRNWEVEITGGKLKTAISRPTDHENLWGDDEGERMDDILTILGGGGIYQSPYYRDTTSGRYEPDGFTGEPSGGWGSNMPDYVSFCLDCHQYQQYDPIRGQNVKKIVWDSSGDRHGAYPSNTCNQGASFEGTLRPPYDDTANSTYVLSCTDCHEPHGAKRKLHLIRRYINGELVAEDTGTCDELADWSAVCQRCHNLAPGHEQWGGCDVCHGHGVTFPGAGPCNGQPTF
jgi:hypothetical protein